MIRTLTLSAAAAMGMMLMTVQATPSAAAPTVAPKMATPDSVVEKARRGGRSFGGHGHIGRSYGRSHGGWSGRRFYGGRHYGGRHYGHRRHYRYGRYYRPYIYGAGIPFFYGGYSYYGGCGYYYRKWQRTGSRYWRNRYYACRW